jgi:hypothetical protein
MIDVAAVEAQHTCDVISVATEFMIDVAGLEAQHTCDVISVATEFMSDVAGLEAQHTCDVVSVALDWKPGICCDPITCLTDVPSLTVTIPIRVATLQPWHLHVLADNMR